MTSSVMTRSLRRLASCMKRRKSFIVPKSGLMLAVVGDVVAVVAAGRGIERQQPQRGDAEVLQVVELLGQAGEVADAVVVAVGERLDVKLIDDRVLVPELVAGELGFGFDVGDNVHGALTPGSGRAGRDRGPDRCAAARRPIRAMCRSPVIRFSIARDAARARPAGRSRCRRNGTRTRAARRGQRDRDRDRIVAVDAIP